MENKKPKISLELFEKLDYDKIGRQIVFKTTLFDQEMFIAEHWYDYENMTDEEKLSRYKKMLEMLFKNYIKNQSTFKNLY